YTSDPSLATLTYHRYLPSFPTRRSSDLPVAIEYPCTEAVGCDDAVIGVVDVHFVVNERYDDTPHCVQHAVLPLMHDVLDTVGRVDRKSTRLNSSHVKISYAVFCLKKKNQ